jgi:hypothetical protein
MFIKRTITAHGIMGDEKNVCSMRTRIYGSVIMIWIIACPFRIYAQESSVMGCVVDSMSHVPLQSVTIILINTKNIINSYSTATDEHGIFQIYHVPQALYLFKTSCVGFRGLEKKITVQKNMEDVGMVVIAQQPVQLKTVDVVAQLPPVEQLHDTVQFNAGAFRTNPDATIEDLVKKLPGVTVENKTVKAQGEEIKQVFIDGKSFFGTDPMIALRNLPADMVDKIQVYDKLSDQAEFTKFDDGQSIKTMNVVTKEDRRHGYFGKIYGGYGNEKYLAGTMLNVFNGDERYTVIASSNNINQQDFAAQDMLGAMKRGGGGGPGGEPGESPGGGSASIGQQSGDNTVHTFGLNYGNQLAKNLYATGNYFYNILKNNNETTVNRQYGIGTSVNQLYNETSSTNNDNYNHRFQMRMEYNIDSLNAIIVDPRLSTQSNDASSTSSSYTNSSEGNSINRAQTTSSINSKGYDLETSMLYRHLFNLQGRTFVANVRFNANRTQSDGFTQSITTYYNNAIAQNDSVNQKAISRSPGRTLESGIAYTEPFGEHHLLQLNYNISMIKNESDKKVYGYDPVDQRYSLLNDSLSNVLSSEYVTQQVGLGYRAKTKAMNLIADVAFQRASLHGDYTFPTIFSLSRDYSNILPMVLMMYRPSSSNALHVMYRTSTASPSISQLQSVMDNSKSTMLTTGNPNLSQSYSHELMLHYSFTNLINSSSIFVMFNARTTNRYIASSTYLFSNDTTLSDGTTLNKGTQLTKPVNVDGYRSVNTMFSYGIPLDWIKCNFNINTGLSYTRTPAVTNDIVNSSQAYSLNQGVVLASNISEDVDFTLIYNYSLSYSKNTEESSLNTHYYQHNANFRTNINVWNGIIMRSDLTHQLYDAEGTSNDQHYILWNLGIAKKLLKNQSLEIALNAYDVLHQNNSLSHTVTSTYIEDTQSKMLTNYVMLTVTYTIRPGTL